MRVIYKYNLAESLSHNVPVEAYFLCLQIDNKTNNPCVWFECNPTAKTEVINFYINGTGGGVSGDTYLGTYQDGPFVWHVYMERL